MSKSLSPSTIRVWQYSTTKGGIENHLKLNSSAPLPNPSAKQHLVQVIAVGINPVDYKLTEIPILGALIRPKVATPGADIAGRIVKPASNSSLRAGQLVFGTADASIAGGGGLAEYTLCNEGNIAAIPPGVKPVDAATIPVAGLTAYQSIVPKVKSGDKVFINGGSGGVGTFAIQFAKAVGCSVTTTCSSANTELCKHIGADEVIDYRNQNVIEALKASSQKYDHIVDYVGTGLSLYWASPEYSKPGAEYVMVGVEIGWSSIPDWLKAGLLPSFLGGGKRKFTRLSPRPSAVDLEKIVSWMNDGTVKAVVDQEFRFEEAPDAIRKVKTGRAKGKIVVVVNPNIV